MQGKKRFNPGYLGVVYFCAVSFGAGSFCVLGLTPMDGIEQGVPQGKVSRRCCIKYRECLVCSRISSTVLLPLRSANAQTEFGCKSTVCTKTKPAGPCMGCMAVSDWGPAVNE